VRDSTKSASTAVPSATSSAGPVHLADSDLEYVRKVLLATPRDPQKAFQRPNVDAKLLGKIFAVGANNLALAPNLAVAGDGGLTPEQRDLSFAGSGDLRFYEPNDIGNVTSRSSTPADGYVLSPTPVMWTPEVGVTVLAATGRTKSAGFVAAFLVDEHGDPHLASTFVMQHDVQPVVLGFHPERRKELFWSSCWKCPGEHGAISVRDDRRVVIVQY
jgi:hypothetical protein